MAKKPSVDIVIPVYNEEKELLESIQKLIAFLRDHLNDFIWNIFIVDNASTDATLSVAKKIEEKNQHVYARHLDQKGRGRAVKSVWLESDSDIVAYMDVDLSSDLKHFPTMIRSLLHGYDIGIGSRNAKGSKVYGRNTLRNITSKGYIILIKSIFWVHFTDAQCGFKAITHKAVINLLPMVEDNEWFFDTELLILAEKMGYKIYEEPVTWVDNPGSTVRVWKTMLGDLQGLWRLLRTTPWKHHIYGRN